MVEQFATCRIVGVERRSRSERVNEIWEILAVCYQPKGVNNSQDAGNNLNAGFSPYALDRSIASFDGSWNKDRID